MIMAAAPVHISVVAAPPFRLPGIRAIFAFYILIEGTFRDLNHFLLYFEYFFHIVLLIFIVLKLDDCSVLPSGNLNHVSFSLVSFELCPYGRRMTGRFEAVQIQNLREADLLTS